MNYAPGKPSPRPLRDDLQSLWLLDPTLTYLNHGSFGAVPRQVHERYIRWQIELESDPIERIGRRMETQLEEAKGAVGASLGMQSANFGFVTNATEGINAVLRSLRLEAGDELLATTHVYGAVRQAMKHVTALAGADYREFPLTTPLGTASELVQTVTANLRPRTRLLVIDHVTSPTALIFPVAELIKACAARQVDVLVDGAHAPGMLDLNVEQLGAAYYAGNLHKWVCAPKGSAFLWVRPDRQRQVHPLVVSHYYGQGLSREFNWQGTRDFAAWLTMPSAFEFFDQFGWDQVRQSNRELAAFAGELLCRRWGSQPLASGAHWFGSMMTIPLPPPLDKLPEPQLQRLQQRLHDVHRVEVPLLLWQGTAHARPCAQIYNTAADYERLAEVVLQER